MQRTRGERAFNIVNIAALAVLMVAVFVPLLNVVSTSLVSTRELARRAVVLLPEEPDLFAYTFLLRKGNLILTGYQITLFRVVVGTFVNMTFTYFTGYALSRRDLPGRTALTVFLFFTMMFGGGLIPYYVIMRAVGLLNRVWVYIIPGLVSVWYVLLMRNFIMNIPLSLTESAEIDGANQLVIIGRIVLPLSTPALVTLALFYAVGHWNSWWDAYLFVSDARKQPVQLYLRNMLAQTTVLMDSVGGRVNVDEVLPPSRSVQNAAIVVATLPIVLVYPFVQKYFIRGIMMGSIKG